MKQAALIIGFIVIAVFIAVILFQKESEVVDDYCVIDSDCVPAQCCHATSAVNKLFSPNCKGVACTEICVPGTLDCGQGNIQCIENRCVVYAEGNI